MTNSNVCPNERCIAGFISQGDATFVPCPDPFHQLPNEPDNNQCKEPFCTHHDYKTGGHSNFEVMVQAALPHLRQLVWHSDGRVVAKAGARSLHPNKLYTASTPYEAVAKLFADLETLPNNNGSKLAGDTDVIKASETYDGHVLINGVKWYPENVHQHLIDAERIAGAVEAINRFADDLIAGGMETCEKHSKGGYLMSHQQALVDEVTWLREKRLAELRKGQSK